MKPWRNAQRVSFEALAKEDMLRRVSPKKPEGPRLPFFRSICYGGWIKPWGSTFHPVGGSVDAEAVFAGSRSDACAP